MINMDYSEVKHRIIRNLPDDFLQDNKNREALELMEEACNLMIPQQVKYKNRHGEGLDLYHADYYNCPKCGRRLRNKQHDQCCGRCGQRITWE